MSRFIPTLPAYENLWSGLLNGSMVVTLITLSFMVSNPAGAQNKGAFTPVIVIHGGAGTIEKSEMSPEQEKAYRAKLEEALRAGYAVLTGGGTSLEAVERTINILEDSPLFNAGTGAVLTNEGTVELDASLMDGQTHAAGAVAGVRHIKNPISLARMVMEKSPHVMMAGDGAEQFAREQGVVLVPNESLQTEKRKQQLEAVKAREKNSSYNEITVPEKIYPLMNPGSDRKMGTVGAVALDVNGNLAAGTSTGGMMNKRYGRIGDSPVIGAGTYADNATCAVSATGHGEYFIRGVIAHDISALMSYAGLSLSAAANAVIHGKLTDAGGTGGVIGLDRQGHISMPFNTSGMYRGFIDQSGRLYVAIYRDEE